MPELNAKSMAALGEAAQDLQTAAEQLYEAASAYEEANELSGDERADAREDARDDARAAFRELESIWAQLTGAWPERDEA